MTHESSPTVAPPDAIRYRVTGMDCAHDAAEIERTARGLSGVRSVRVSTALHVMSVQVDDAEARLPAVERAVAGLGYRLDRLGDADLDRAEAPGRVAAGYRRALWIAVLLNLGYGVVETVGGVIAGSQALRADALDFLGDGLITFLGLLAIGWSVRWRARAALLQGLFLGTLGIGVLANTAYRVFVQQQPEAGLMGIFGAVALLVNVAAAAVLIPHRAGDANVRAVWLFSRNDAIGNLAVVLASGLVAWTRSPWPDLVVAVAIAGLFLHSSWVIVRDSRIELRLQGDP